MKLTQERKDLVQPNWPGMIFQPPVSQWVELGEGEKLSIAEVSTKYSLLWFIMTPLHHPTPKYTRYTIKLQWSTEHLQHLVLNSQIHVSVSQKV